MRNWVLLIVAAVFEVCWVIGLNQASSVLEWGGTGVAIVVSFLLLLQATKELPVATAYAVFVGLGTVGSVAVDTLVPGSGFTSC
ncbi:DMT family transporter [Alkalicoccobacillus plakortidis]|uniref:DMT family transporter n=1 Tax=Alkalicoccobacillus plakortidis TaxID=444060 RepID=UPI0027D9B1DC|nr:SMR family transporter [Alkalicoccobacillus plakortidis]